MPGRRWSGSQGITLSIEQRLTHQVYTAIREVVANGRPQFRPGDVASFLREQGQPLDTWEIRGEFSKLEASGDISLDAATGAWSLAKAASRKAG